MSSTLDTGIDALRDLDALGRTGLTVTSISPEVRDGPDGRWVYLLVRLQPSPSDGDAWDLDAAFELRQALRRRAVELGIEDHVVVVLASDDPRDAPEDDQTEDGSDEIDT